MIRLRKTNGDTIMLPPEFQFVELVDMDGKVGLVFFKQGQTIVSFDEDSLEAKRYKTLYKDAEFCPVKEFKEPDNPILISNKK